MPTTTCEPPDFEDDDDQPIDSIDRDFRIFHGDNPHVEVMLTKMSFKVLKTGREHYSMKTLIAVARWHLTFDTENAEGHKLKLTDRWSSRYARLIMKNNPTLEGFFRIRKLRGHYKHTRPKDESREAYVRRTQAWQDAVDDGRA
jgi:tRNA-dihydrouridine synthase